MWSLEGLSRWFWERGASTAVRGLDRGALERLAGDGRNQHGLDVEFSRYMELAHE